eukprot:2156968-Amphidinium_carterae.1
MLSSQGVIFLPFQDHLDHNARRQPISLQGKAVLQAASYALTWSTQLCMALGIGCPNNPPRRTTTHYSNPLGPNGSATLGPCFESVLNGMAANHGPASQRDVRIFKVKSHQQQPPRGHPQWHQWYGNDQADQQATAASWKRARLGTLIGRMICKDGGKQLAACEQAFVEYMQSAITSGSSTSDPLRPV